jgi:hypothetical protein
VSANSFVPPSVPLTIGCGPGAWLPVAELHAVSALSTTGAFTLRRGPVIVTAPPKRTCPPSSIR